MKIRKIAAIVLSVLMLTESPILVSAETAGSPITAETAAGTMESGVLQAETDHPLPENNEAEGREEPEAIEEDRQEAEVIEDVKEDEVIKVPFTEAGEGGIENSGTEKDDEEEITLNYYEYTLIAGDSLQLEANSSSGKTVTFRSSDSEIAVVSETTGLVTAKNIGTCEITAETDNGSETCNIIVIGDITISETKVTLYIGQNRTLQTVTRPQSTVKWSSSAPDIAAVGQTGIITAKKAGKAVISAEANGIIRKCTVTVNSKTLKLNKSKLTAYIGYPAELQATTAPSAKVTWKSSDKKTAAIDSNGIITPKKAGKVTITATGNGISKTCTVTVKNPSLHLDTAKLYVFVGNTKQITAKAAPAASVTWKSKNSKIAGVDKNGRVTGKAAGKTTITGTHGKIKKTCEVNVIKNTYKLNKTKNTLTKGDSVKLYMKNVGADGYVNFSIDSGADDAVTISANGNQCTVKAVKAGKVTIRGTYYYNIDGVAVDCSNTATVTVKEAGISPQQCAVAVGKTRQFKIINEAGGKTVSSAAWASSDNNVASITATGLLTAKKTGTIKVTAKVTYADGISKEYTSTVKVSNPRLKSTYKTAAESVGYTIGISGANSYSNINWKSNKPGVANVGSGGQVSVYSSIPQKVKITATVDGKKLTHQLIITKPSLKDTYKLLTTGKKAKIKVKGTNSKSKVKYKSLNPSVAAVNSKGVVTARKNGNASIEVTADGKKMVFTAHVAPKKAISAVKKAESIMYSSTYSQPYRMSKGYYDCSSLTFRGYGADGVRLLGGSFAWAPTAAAQAYYLAATGKAIAYGGVDVSQLRPGDLIFYGGANNGRYKGIYHVSMYYGGGLRLEKPFRYYYEEGSIVMVARPIS